VLTVELMLQCYTIRYDSRV